MDKTGEQGINIQELKMWIRTYRGCNDIDVEFEDGYISYNRKYVEFKKGKISNKNFRNPRNKERIGEIKVNNFGSKMRIVEYNVYNDILVEFDNGYKVKSSYKEFKNGAIKSPYDKSVFGVGYLGEGNYKNVIDGKNTLSYQYWSSMIKRCYSKLALEKNQNYKPCFVTDEWHNFQNFAQWFESNYYTVENEVMQLDKDILFKENKIYSSNTCIFVPERINKLFINICNIKDKRGGYPIGVRQCQDNPNAYSCQCSIKDDNGNRKLKYLGQYSSPENAFYKGYKPFKEKYIKEVADDYKDRIPMKLYDAMYNWVINIDD